MTVEAAREAVRARGSRASGSATGTGGPTGRSYLARGLPVTVLAAWRGRACPRNVLVARPDGSLVVRPFRGLRRTS